jgi:NAD-dependent SIR2 family protein deacetylase
MLLVTGAGASSSSGLPTFSSGTHGLYRRAQDHFGLRRGSSLFTGQFLLHRRTDALDFFAELASECSAAPTPPAYTSIASIQHSSSPLLVRHLTLNIDGLSRRCCSQFNAQTAGSTIELHGCVLDSACERCRSVALAHSHRAEKCPHCGTRNALRPAMMLYGDPHEELSTNTAYTAEQLKIDCQNCNVVLWIGVSFEQRASAEHFYRINACTGNSDNVLHCIVNPNAEDCIRNLTDGLQWDVSSSANIILANVDADSFLEHLSAQSCS